MSQSPLQEVPSSPYLRDLLLRLATLESVAARGRAIIATFTEASEAAEKSAARGEAAAEAEMAKHRAQVGEQEEDIVSDTLTFILLLSALNSLHTNRSLIIFRRRCGCR